MCASSNAVTVKMISRFQVRHANLPDRLRVKTPIYLHLIRCWSRTHLRFCLCVCVCASALSSWQLLSLYGHFLSFFSYLLWRFISSVSTRTCHWTISCAQSAFLHLNIVPTYALGLVTDPFARGLPDNIFYPLRKNTLVFMEEQRRLWEKRWNRS